MHEKLTTLKSLLKTGEYEKAAEALKAYRTGFPNDWDGKLMEGLIAQFLGDGETFRRIHDEAQAAINKHDDQAKQIQASPLWRKYHSNWKKIATVAIIGMLIVGAVIGTIHLWDQLNTNKNIYTN